MDTQFIYLISQSDCHTAVYGVLYIGTLTCFRQPIGVVCMLATYDLCNYSQLKYIVYR